MPEKKILIVEDERIVAEDLKRLLIKMGYAVTGIAASGEDALKSVKASLPDLVLMDIRIQGPQDGIETAEHLYAEYNVPVSYLTAYADATTLERAKATMPFGYILKPFEARSLQTVIELALHRHAMEQILPRLDGWHARALNGLTDALIGTDERGSVTFMNKAAEALTGWAPEGLFGKPLETLFTLGEEPASSNGNGAGRDAKVPERNGFIKTKGGDSLSVKYIRAALPGGDGAPDGVLIIVKKT